MRLKPTASYSITLRVRIEREPGMLGRVASAIGEAGGAINTVENVSNNGASVVRDFTIDAQNEAHRQQIVDQVKGVAGVEVVSVTDRTYHMHDGGKIEICSKSPLETRDDLSMAYTPGVARVCKTIHDEPASVYQYTIKQNTVAVVSDGTAVLGLGDIGPEAALPVMEGKAMLFKEFGKVDAFPICLATKDTEEIIETVTRLAPVFGGINLEDISAPRCFEIEDRLRETLDIPVFHDDQHGTAVVVLAAYLNAMKLTGRKAGDMKVVVLGAGAAGNAIAKILLSAGTRNIIVCDRAGAIYKGRGGHMNPSKEWLAEHTNPNVESGTVSEVMKGADVFIGLSGPGLISVDDVRNMAKDPIIFAMANPTPEILPEEVEGIVRVMATGRSDYPNQINNVLCFPGLFRGLLDCQSRGVNEEIKLAAAQAIAAAVPADKLNEKFIIPSVFDQSVAPAVASAVIAAALRTGMARQNPAEESAPAGQVGNN